MTRPSFEHRARRALFVGASALVCSWLLSACIDTPLSLGRHDVAAPPSGGTGGVSATGGSGGTFMMMDAAITSGGQGGSPPTPTLDSGPMPLPDAEPPAATPCDDGTMSVQLECQIDDGFIGPPGSMRPPPMTTSTTLTLVRRPDRSDAALATGQLSFSAWNLTFDARLEGELDCTSGTFVAAIVDGEAMSPSAPPGPFYGELEGLLDPFSGDLSGPWWHGPELQGPPRCIGPWTASRD